jgi:hypothetical protein
MGQILSYMILGRRKLPLPPSDRVSWSGRHTLAHI